MPGTASSSGRCSALYHSLNSLSCLASMSTYTRKMPLPFFATFYPFCCEEPPSSYETRLRANVLRVSAESTKPNQAGPCCSALGPNWFLVYRRSLAAPSRRGNAAIPRLTSPAITLFCCRRLWTHLLLTWLLERLQPGRGALGRDGCGGTGWRSSLQADAQGGFAVRPIDVDNERPLRLGITAAPGHSLSVAALEVLRLLLGPHRPSQCANATHDVFGQVLCGQLALGCHCALALVAAVDHALAVTCEVDSFDPLGMAGKP